jgi:hypothetical protein
LKLQYDERRSNFAFKINSRRYTLDANAVVLNGAVRKGTYHR